MRCSPLWTNLNLSLLPPLHHIKQLTSPITNIKTQSLTSTSTGLLRPILTVTHPPMSGSTTTLRSARAAPAAAQMTRMANATRTVSLMPTATNGSTMTKWMWAQTKMTRQQRSPAERTRRTRLRKAKKIRQSLPPKSLPRQARDVQGGHAEHRIQSTRSLKRKKEIFWAYQVCNSSRRQLNQRWQRNRTKLIKIRGRTHRGYKANHKANSLPCIRPTIHIDHRFLN